MPLVLKPKDKTGATLACWHSLSYHPGLSLLIYSDRPGGIAGAEYAVTPPYTVQEQARILTEKFHICAFEDSMLLDPGNQAAELLNKRGDRPDFTRQDLGRGWLSPKGEFLGCNHGDHADLFHYTVGLPKECAKKDGWITIWDDDWCAVNPRLPPTPAQEASLKALGFFE